MKPTHPNETTVGDAVFHRRAVRHFTSQPLQPEQVRELLLAAVQAPSALNQQPWAFGVFHGHDRLRVYSRLAKDHLVATYPTNFELHARSALYEDPNYDLFHRAGTLVVIYATPGHLYPAEDCCLAAQNLMLTAYSLGLGSCPIGFARDWLNLPATKRLLDVPDNLTAVFPLVLGYPASPTEVTGRDEPRIASWQWDPEPEPQREAATHAQG